MRIKIEATYRSLNKSAVNRMAQLTAMPKQVPILNTLNKILKFLIVLSEP